MSDLTDKNGHTVFNNAFAGLTVTQLASVFADRFFDRDNPVASTVRFMEVLMQTAMDINERTIAYGKQQGGFAPTVAHIENQNDKLRYILDVLDGIS